MADEKQTQFALIALVGIVAVVGIIGLTFMMVAGKTQAVSMAQPTMISDSGNAAGLSTQTTFSRCLTHCAVEHGDDDVNKERCMYVCADQYIATTQ